MAIKEHVIIAGGGLFGLTSAIVLAENGYKVTVIEKNNDILKEASLVNQNRIHYGYHYPRSIATGKEALEGLPSFKEYYGNCINDSFTKYYAVAKKGSLLTAEEYVAFCDELDIQLNEEWPTEAILNRDLLEMCWKVYEPVFDYHTLRIDILKRLNVNKSIRILRNAQIENIERFPNNRIKVMLNNGYNLDGNFLVNATYSGLTDVLKLFNEQILKANYELLVLPILKIKESIAPFGITIMDGPFCSLVPRGFVKDEYILSHVKLSVIQSHLGYSKPEWNIFDGIVEKEIIENCKQYFPILDEMEYQESWITTKIVLPQQDIDDARPTLLLEHGENICSVFSGKVTTCVLAANKILAKVNKLFK